MRVFFIIIFAILLFIATIYLAFIIRVKLNITINEAVLLIRIKLIRFQKSFIFRFNYYRLIKNILDKDKNKDKKSKFKRDNFNIFKSLFRTIYIKNIDVYSECFEEKFSIAIEFSVVNIITKRGVLSE